jgi:hypothetical protein
LRTLSWATTALLFLVLAAEAVPASSSPSIGHWPPELARLDPQAEYEVDGKPATHAQVRALDPAEIRSIEVVSRHVVSQGPAPSAKDNTIRVTTRNGPVPLPRRQPIAFEGVGGPDPRIRLSDDLTFAARDVRLLLDGKEIDAERLGTVDPSRIDAVKVIRWGTAKPEVHLTTRQRI